MKTCLNCNTLNEADATTCKNCRMKGRFAPIAPASPSPKIGEMPVMQLCRNCGQDVQGQAQCPHCRFPLRPASKTAAAIHLSIPDLNRPSFGKSG